MKTWGMLLCLLVCLPAWAAKVGPRDGQAGPTLPALATPAGVATEVLDDRAYEEKAANKLMARLLAGEAVNVVSLTAVQDQDLVDAVRYAAAWQAALTGAPIQTFELARAQQLQARVAELDKALNQRAEVAFWLGLVPGLGHAYGGETRIAAVNLMLAGLLGWVVLFAARRGHVPYVVMWGLVLMALVSQSAGDARRKMLAHNVTLRTETMQAWDDLKPTAIVPVVVKPGDGFVMGTPKVSQTVAKSAALVSESAI